MGVTAFQTIHPWEAGDISAGIDFVHWGGSTWNSPKADPGMRDDRFKEYENEYYCPLNFF